MAGFHKLTAGLWQVKVWSTEKGPAGTIQATFVANEVSCVHHLYTAIVLRHEPGDLFVCFLIFGDAEFRKNQHLVSLQPVDVCPTVLVRLGCPETELMYVREMSPQDASEP